MTPLVSLARQGAIMVAMSHPWVPFGLSDDEADTYVKVLLDGVPPHLKVSLLDWLRSVLAGKDRVNAARTREIERTSEVQIGLAGDTYWSTYVGKLSSLGDLPLLRVTDAILASGWYGMESYAVKLESLLASSRSKWTVGERRSRLGLVAWVPEGVQDTVEGTIADAGTAGMVLARAWSQVHDLTPNDSGAYADAVRAVEIAAISVVQPKKHDATLGTVLGQMKADGDWRLDLREHADAPGPEMVLAMGRTLWFGHRDRHGSVNYTDVTHQEARQAVALAAVLVDWFSSGAIQRRPPR